MVRHERLHILAPRSNVRRKQIATVRIPPKSKAMSPMLNSPSPAWSASSGIRVCNVALCHIGLAGTTVDGIPTTGIDPALLSVTKAFIPSPQSISRTPVRTNGDRTTRNTRNSLLQQPSPEQASLLQGLKISPNSCWVSHAPTLAEDSHNVTILFNT